MFHSKLNAEMDINNAIEISFGVLVSRLKTYRIQIHTMCLDESVCRTCFPSPCINGLFTTVLNKLPLLFPCKTYYIPCKVGSRR